MFEQLLGTYVTIASVSYNQKQNQLQLIPLFWSIDVDLKKYS